MASVSGGLDDCIIVTGGAGFIGSALIRDLLDRSASRVINVDKLTYAANLDSIPQAKGNTRYRLEQVDICDGPELRRVFQATHPKAVVNLAAETHVDRSIDGPTDFIQTNLVGTFTLLQEALRYWQGLGGEARDNFRILHVSTDEVFGTLPEHGLFTESSPYLPNSPYSATKAGSDHLVRAWHETYGLPTLLTNCSNNFGPYQFPEKLIPHMIMRGLAGQALPIYGDGLNIRDWLHVGDHAAALILVLERGAPGETYNIGARCERSNRVVVETICDLLDEFSPASSGPRRGLIEFVTDRPGHDRRYAIDPGKLESRHGWRPAYTFERGLAETVRWYMDNRAWWQPILERGYNAARVGLKKIG